MKRIITAAFLAAIVLGICLFGRSVTEKQTGRIAAVMEEIGELLAEGDTEQALKISEEFQAEWETIHGQLCLFLQHEHLDPLESVFAVLPYYIEQGEITLAQSECRLVRSVTEHILKTERVTLENIL